MIFRKAIFLFLFMLCCINCYSQVTGNVHIKKISVKNDTIILDTLSLIPSTFFLYDDNGSLLDTSNYKINYAEGKLIINRKVFINNYSSDSLKISYKTFPYLFTAETKHKDINLVKPNLIGNANPFSYSISSKNDDIFKMEGLNKTGSISRGFTIGNNQDMVVNSNLNLQLSGHLNNNIDILLAATDNNIPIQADGNTQQIQEFDKVFIQLNNQNSKLIAGDFQLTRPSGYFMNFNKKAQGVSFSTIQKTKKKSKEPSTQGIYKTILSAAVSRGKFARNQIQGVESNQGPYRLKGAENESFIIVLSGTEKVYIDGRAVDRGQENDYVINYNTAEITFTARQLITKDKRITVEFQYSDKNYVRSLFNFGNDYEQKNLKLHFHFYSEQDSKNQPLQQNLSDEQKLLLTQIGDTLSHAITPSVDSIAFNNSEVLYNKIDTTIGTHNYFKVYKYSTNSDSAHFRVGFSNVGVGNGNYNQITSNANGRVFQWIMPDTLTGKPRGAYEPVIQLITPKKKQMVTAGVDYVFGKNTKLALEAALTNNDINTFSTNDSKDDVGYGMKMNLDNVLTLSKNKTEDTVHGAFKLLTNINYEYVQKYFSPVERYRNIEFERDWNRGTSTTYNDQHIAGASITLIKNDLGTLGYKFNLMDEGEKYNANKQNIILAIRKKGFTVIYDASLMRSQSTINTSFYRHKREISQKIKFITIGIKDEYERNLFKTETNKLRSNSYQFWQWQAFVQNADTTKNRYGLFYKQRTDWAVKDSVNLQSSTLAEELGGYLELIKNTNNQLKINTSYRKLNILNKSITAQKPDNTLVGRIEYNFNALKGFIYSNTFYEIGSGLEIKKEFSYLQVAPGLGVYTWIDYNNDSIKQLDEFEVSQFSDQATYIKVYTPTSEYVKVYTNQFSEVLTLKPAAVWAGKKGFRKFVSRFSNQTSFRIDNKSTDSILINAFNPFKNVANNNELQTLNSSFRNTLLINQSGAVFGMDISYQDTKNKILLVNGIDSRQSAFEEARLRWNIFRQFSFNAEIKNGTKRSESQYFHTKDYKIIYYELEPKVTYQPTSSFRAALLFRYTDKLNIKMDSMGGQHATLQNYGAELKYNVLNKGSFNIKANYILITYNDKQLNTSLAFEMLDALKTGKNITWGVSYQRNLSNNMQLSLTYDGRISQGSKAIHTGGAQVRAYF